MYYSIYDKETETFLHTGRNSKTKTECVNDCIDFMSNGMETEDVEILNNSRMSEKIDFLNTYNYIVEKHDTLIKDDDFPE